MPDGPTAHGGDDRDDGTGLGWLVMLEVVKAQHASPRLGGHLKIEMNATAPPGV
jgi:hypothetical protein